MDRLWAPWRSNYVKRELPEGGPPGGGPQAAACFFCEGLAADAALDRQNLVAWRGPDAVVFLNKFPYNAGHVLVAPPRHSGRLGDFSGAELTGPVETIRRVISILDVMLRPHGYNIGLNEGRAAGAGVPGHLHWHIVPRWDGDSNFMPVLAQTRVIVESLDEFYDRLAAELHR